MPNFLLNAQSVILCPHGAPVIHVPVTFTTYRVHGYPPLLLTDNYIISGCPAMAHGAGGCNSVQWVNPSPTMFVRGIPVLTNATSGICITATGVPSGPAMIANFQPIVQEPTDLKMVDQ